MTTKRVWDEVWDVHGRMVHMRWQGSGPGGHAEFTCHAGEEPKATEEARAMLAGAAPELYRALAMLVDCIEAAPMPLVHDAAAMHDARAALRKARGEGRRNN